MKRLIPQVLLTALAVLSAMPAFAAPAIDTTDKAVTVTLSNGAKLQFALDKGQVLGLNTAAVKGVALKSDTTVVRPYIAQEFSEKPLMVNALHFAGAKADGEAVRITMKLDAAPTADLAGNLFQMTADNKIRRDYYGFAHLRLPAETVTVKEVAARKTASAATEAGTLTWVIEPVTLNIGGWTWQGWKHHYEFELPEAMKINTLRELSTWELTGQPVGNTLVAMRYRGLGGVVAPLQAFDPTDSSKGVTNAFTTTEILPGAVGKEAMISPVPNVGHAGKMNREQGMMYRYGAWIAHLQRGAGANWVDFQYRPAAEGSNGAAFAAWYERMDAIRSLTEAWPQDSTVSQTDNLMFPLTNKGKTVAKIHVALVPDKALPEHEWRTRWFENDQYVRNVIADELKMVQFEPVPTLGINWDSGWAFRLRNAIKSVDGYKANGIKRVASHHPGWFNGRGLRQKETSFPIPKSMQLPRPKKGEAEPKEMALLEDTGGDCSIHDYIPQSEEIAKLWKEYGQKLNENDIEYWVWITGMVYGTGPVVQKFGEDRFTRNLPDVDFSHGYPGQRGAAGHRGISMRDPDLRKWWTDRMADASKELGVQGFWADSFQNMYMSQMNYQHKDWAPQVREWFEWIAEISRQGVGFQSESHMFPGLSCSIEVGDVPKNWEGSEWTLNNVVRWYRGEPVPGAKTPAADRLFYRTMANRGPIAPGGHGEPPTQIPNMKKHSDEYMAALPNMQRAYQLPDNKGVLWLTNASDATGILFPFEDMDLPKGVTGSTIVGSTPADKLAAQTTYTLKGDDLLAAFGFQRGDAKDPRIGQEYKRPRQFVKKWD